ncbi:hypothetical protein FS800_24350 [Agrobacterium vitis]|uniref:hypothetical protein n=1 Tax=Rhizobium/Agrobacterium group TaxID=227290 RepID=UPI001573ACCA|nr:MULTISPECIES: hypothetical protein [Rhizobium/Agrobacterium group]MCF1485254.1 hypothetical protein [Allorhizobium ampelinum]NSZ19585.1 hypothetical protein [Agrobacterium vitis]QZO07319.1 hypothetical protein K4831_24230 [Agrobacterium vitis]UJL91082.1 hypothetical protein AVF2S5_24145 [Agrobacterium vitis]BCH62256.1 hypothetical protein RvVAR0630_pl03980 [Agrobacterium vitis]
MAYIDQNTVPSHSNTITAFFHDRSEADRAIEGLSEAGIPRSAIKMIADGSETTTTTHESKGFWAALGSFSSLTMTATPTPSQNGGGVEGLSAMLSIPESEIVKLLFGLVTVAVPSSTNTTLTPGRGTLRLVKISRQKLFLVERMTTDWRLA